MEFRTRLMLNFRRRYFIRWYSSTHCILWSWTVGTNRLYRPIRIEADISRLHVRHQNASTFDAQTDARGKKKREISEKLLSAVLRFYYFGSYLKTQYFSVPAPRRRPTACAMVSDEGLDGRPRAWPRVPLVQRRGAEHTSQMGNGCGGGRAGWRWRPASPAGPPPPRRDGGRPA